MYFDKNDYKTNNVNGIVLIKLQMKKKQNLYIFNAKFKSKKGI